MDTPKEPTGKRTGREARLVSDGRSNTHRDALLAAGWISAVDLLRQLQLQEPARPRLLPDAFVSQFAGGHHPTVRPIPQRVPLPAAASPMAPSSLPQVPQLGLGRASIVGQSGGTSEQPSAFRPVKNTGPDTSELQNTRRPASNGSGPGHR